MKTKTPTIFLFIAATTLVTPGDAFSSNRVSLSSEAVRGRPLNGRTNRGVLSQPTHTAKLESTSTLFSRDPSMQEGIFPSEKGESQAMTEKENESPDVKDTVRKAGKKVGLAALYGFSFFMNIVGMYFTAGLLLNLCGYAYEFSFEEGYKIDTIEHKRIERQFEQESMRYQRERDARVAQFSTESAANTFGSETVAKLAENTK